MSDGTVVVDGKKYPVQFTSPLVRRFELMRQQGLKKAPNFHTAEAAREFLEHTKIEFVKRFCQLGVNARWHYFKKELIKNYRLDAQGRFSEMTIPEMIEDPANWTEEDIAVFKSLRAAKLARQEAENE